jgi:hypothetical protein
MARWKLPTLEEESAFYRRIDEGVCLKKYQRKSNEPRQ